MRLGEGGDGIAETADGRLYVPLTVPGDRVRALPLRPRSGGFAARLLEVIAAGPGRTQPPCPHYGLCGGCALQHLTDDAYASWKVARLTAALARLGLAGCRIGPLVRTPPGSRRRATFTAARSAGAPCSSASRSARRTGSSILRPARCSNRRSSPCWAPLRRLLGGYCRRAPG
ncbi:MAG: hypothetical protein U1E38_03290 [Rhodospirillales bacterium]